MHIFTYFFILLKGSFIMPETWILDSSLGKYINLYLLGLKKKKRLESQPSRFLHAFLEHNWMLLETVTSKSALHIVEERLKWTKGLFCDHMSSCFAAVRNDFAKTIVCCYWVLSQLQLNPSQTSLAKNSLCNLISEARCILFMKWWDRSINFRVCSEMGVGQGWVCLFAVSQLSPQLLYCASLAFSITHHFCSEVGDLYSMDLALPLIDIQTLMTSTGFSFSSHFILHNWVFHFVFRVYSYSHVCFYYITVYFVMALTQMTVNVQVEFTSSLNFSAACHMVRYRQLWLHLSLNRLVCNYSHVPERLGMYSLKIKATLQSCSQNLDYFQRM